MVDINEYVVQFSTEFIISHLNNLTMTRVLAMSHKVSWVGVTIV